jgi:dTDP-4-dehydrorhamnose 3,5-epimerase
VVSPSGSFEQRPTDIDGLLAIQAKHVDDARGRVREVYRMSTFQALSSEPMGAPLQVNLTSSRRGTIRGLHAEEMTKLVGVVAGEGFGAYLDARPASPTFGGVVTCRLEPGVQMLVPRGVCNGFQALVDDCLYLYCFDAEWFAGMPGIGVNPLDPFLDIEWPIAIDPADRSLISAKDVALPNFAELVRSPDLLD